MATAIRILMLEDSPTDAELIQRELRKSLAFKVKQVETKEEFIREIDNFNPDLILADYALPKFDGISALFVLREKGLSIPFIFVTGSMSEEIAVECMKYGAADYILKNNLMRLAVAIENALEKKRATQEKESALLKLRESEKRFRSLIENCSDIITVLDREGSIIYASPSVEPILGFKADEIIGKTIYEFVKPEEGSLIISTLDDAIKNPDHPLTKEFHFQNKSGVWLAFDVAIKSCLADPAVSGLVMNAHCLTKSNAGPGD